MIPPLRGGDFQGIAGLSSDDSLLVGGNSARAKFQEGPRAVKHRLDEPGQIIPQHGCVPALPASVSPGSGNFSRKSKVVRAAQYQASAIAHRGWKSSYSSPLPVWGEVFFLTFPFIDQASLRTPVRESFDPRGRSMHYERTPRFTRLKLRWLRQLVLLHGNRKTEGSGRVMKRACWAVSGSGGFAPAPPGFSALLPLPMRGLYSRRKEGCRSIPPRSVEATESALRLLPSRALSSAQLALIITTTGAGGSGAWIMALYPRGKVHVDTNHLPPRRQLR